MAPPRHGPTTRSKIDRPPASLNKEKWQYSEARKIIAQDMIDGIVPIDEKIKDTRKLYEELYAHLPEFNDFPFDKTRYDTRVKSLQGIVTKLKWAAQYDAEAFAHDRAIHPASTHGHTGTLLWKGSEADNWLKVDMNSGLHNVPNFKPQELRMTRDCYQQFSKRRFSKRVDQLRQRAKPFGKTPGQAASKREKKKTTNVGDHQETRSRGRLLDPYVNEADDA